MKKILAVFAFCAMSAMAAEWSGYIVDAACAGKKEDHGAGEDHAACSARCIKGGSPAVLVSDGKVFKISNQDKVVAHAGHKVTLTGTVDGDTIEVESVKM
jgi:predicted amidohydrolase